MGVNVTVPHKVARHGFSRRARCRRPADSSGQHHRDESADGQLIGYNTDGEGFIDSILRRQPDRRQASCVVTQRNECAASRRRRLGARRSVSRRDQIGRRQAADMQSHHGACGCRWPRKFKKPAEHALAIERERIAFLGVQSRPDHQLHHQRPGRHPQIAERHGNHARALLRPRPRSSSGTRRDRIRASRLRSAMAQPPRATSSPTIKLR